MELFKNLDNFLRPNSKAESDFKNLTKQLYDNAKKLKSIENDNLPSNQINNLIVDFMDDEGIWTQLDIENQQFLKTYIKEFCQNEMPQDEEDNFVNNVDNEIYDTDNSMDEDDNLENEELDDEDEELDDEELDDEDEELDDEELDEEDEELDNKQTDLKNKKDDLSELDDDSELEDESYDDTLFKQSESNKINYDEELDDEEDDDDNDDDDIGNDELMSEFQKSDAKVKQKAKELEEELLKEKPWQLKGEVSATDRPQDSLLEEYVDFESAIRPVPIYTEEFTKKLEDIILQRVKTNKFDSVEKKERKIELPFDFKRRILLDTEKSKDSLSKVYENEYLKQKNQSQTTEEDPQHKEIKEKMRRLFVQLDSLCNFNYIPKSSSSEIKVINNLPAISVEEAIPDTVSDANLIAPQEIIPIQKHDLKTDLEKTKTDKLRERRLKKKIVKDKIRLKQQNGLNINFKKFKTMDATINKKSTDSDQVKNAFMKSRKHR